MDPITISALAGAVSQTATAIPKLIADISDQKQRRLYEQSYAQLSATQKAALDKALLEQGDEQAKLKLLSDTLGQYNVARINAITQAYSEKQRSELEKSKLTNNLIIIGIVAGTALLITLLYMRRKK